LLDLVLCLCSVDQALCVSHPCINVLVFGEMKKMCFENKCVAKHSNNWNRIQIT
jgi:hypothetical protein